MASTLAHSPGVLQQTGYVPSIHVVFQDVVFTLKNIRHPAFSRKDLHQKKLTNRAPFLDLCGLPQKSQSVFEMFSPSFSSSSQASLVVGCGLVNLWSTLWTKWRWLRNPSKGHQRRKIDYFPYSSSKRNVVVVIPVSGKCFSPILWGQIDPSWSIDPSMSGNLDVFVLLFVNN